MYRRRGLIKGSTFFFFLAILGFTLNLLVYQALDLAQYKNVLRIFSIGCLLISVACSYKRFLLQLVWTCIALYGIVMIIVAGEHAGGNAANIVVIVLIILASLQLSEEELRMAFLSVAYLSIGIWIILIGVGAISISPWDTTRVSGIGSTYMVINRIRYSLGFLYEINLGAWYLTSALTIILALKGMEKGRVVIISGINILIYIITDSRTTFYFYVLFLLIYFGFNIWDKRVKKLYVIPKGCITALCIFIFGIPFFSGIIMEHIPWVDTLFSGRLWGIANRIGGMKFHNYLLGAYNDPLACFYYNLLTQYGIIIYMVFFVLINKALLYYSDKKKIIEFSLLLSLLAVGLVEGSLYTPEELSSLWFWSIIGRGGWNYANEKKKLY